MTNHRIERIQEEIRQVVGGLVLTEIQNPLIQTVTITKVILTRDLGTARIYYDTSISEKEREDLQRHLNAARNFVRKQLATQLPLKKVPFVEFFYDDTRDEIGRVESLFSKL